MHAFVSVCVRVSVCVCKWVCVCASERARERELVRESERDRISNSSDANKTELKVVIDVKLEKLLLAAVLRIGFSRKKSLRA